MKEIFLFIIAIAFVSAKINEEQRDLEWEAYKEKFNKAYDPEEDAQRYKTFLESKLKIALHNRRFEEGKESFKMGINQFADKPLEQWKQIKGFKNNTDEVKKRRKATYSPPGLSYPNYVDWRESGCVPPHKLSGFCGAVWAIAVAESMESACCIKYESFESLSAQNVLDCVPASLVCDGYKVMIPAFDYIVSIGGLDTEESYPWYGKVGPCKFIPENISSCPCKCYIYIPYGSEEDLLAAIATVGPVSALIDGSLESFQYYESGVYYDEACSSSFVNSGVLIIGYGTEGTDEYWLVKNYWGDTWGENGYVKIARNRDNQCGIVSDAVYPIV